MAVLIIHLLWGKIQDNSLVNFQSPAIIKGFPKSRIQNQRIKNQHSAGFLRRSVQSPTATHTIFQSPAVMQTLVLEICAWLNQKVPKIVSCAFFFGRLLDDIVLNPNVETAWERGRCAPQETECVSQTGNRVCITEGRQWDPSQGDKHGVKDTGYRWGCGIEGVLEITFFGSC